MHSVSRRAAVQMFCLAGLARPETDPPWRARVAKDQEPGERLIIQGRFLASPGGPPAAGASIFVYQTDAQGIYSIQSGQPRSVARLRGRLTVGPNGEYEIITIRPGAYPRGGIPAHIHVNLEEPGREARELFEFLFEGDPNAKANENTYVLKLQRDAQGVLRGFQDVVIKR